LYCYITLSSCLCDGGILNVILDAQRGNLLLIYQRALSSTELDAFQRVISISHINLVVRTLGDLHYRPTIFVSF